MRISGQRLRIASDIIGFGRHSVNGCQTQITSFVSDGIVRVICEGRLLTVLPSKEKANEKAEATGAQQKRARHGKREPRNYRESKRNNRARFVAGYGYAAESGAGSGPRSFRSSQHR